MNNKVGLLCLGLASVLVLIVSGCPGTSKTPQGSNPPANNTNAIVPAPPRGNIGLISTAEAIQTDPFTVTADGGSFTLDMPDSSLNGLQLNLSADSYPEARQFTLSYADITQQTFGAAFNPLTPLISIENGGGYAAEIMTVKIPVQVPPGSFAMGFIYDDKAGTLEGLPTVEQNNLSITVGTRHFSKIVISSITDSLLAKDIDSGFRPGVDDWEFPNEGSYIAPKGHCTGQSMTAMWYYCTQPDGLGATLYGRYDNNGNQPSTPQFWQDDSSAYRFSSVVWADMNWASLSRKISEQYLSLSDEITWKMFAYSMQLSGQPQMTEIWNTPTGSGHAMVVYRVANGQLYIADPNFPGKADRRINYSSGKFAPYNSGDNAASITRGKTVNYDKITYVAKTALSDWGKIAERWTDVIMDVIGDTKFPKYDLIWIDDKNQSYILNNGDVFRNNLVNISASSTQAKIFIDAYRDGKILNYDSKGNYQLNLGKNTLGFLITGDVGGDLKYIDFKYLNIFYDPGLSIDPPVLNGVATIKEYTFKAIADSQLGGTRFDWFIDGKLMQSKPDQNYTVTFNSAGKYTVTVKMFDKAGKELIRAQSSVTITENASTPTVKTTPGGGSLSKFQKMKWITVTVGGKQTWNYTHPGTPPTSETTSTTQIIQGYQTKITWSGTSFTGKGAPGADPLNSGGWEISGQLSADGNTLISLNYSYDTIANEALNNNSHHSITKIRLQNVPLVSGPNAYDSQTLITGRQTQDYVSALESILENTLNSVVLDNRYISTDWAAVGDEAPYINVIFGNY